MKVFNSIKRILNISGPQIDMVTRDSEYYPADLIRGELLITAPDYRQDIRSITINLKEFWVEYLAGAGNRLGNRADRYRQHDSRTVVGYYVFNPGMKYQFPFEIRLPVNCRVSSKESGWRLGIVVSAAGFSVYRADFNIIVQLSKVLQEIIGAIERDAKFAEVPRGRKYLTDLSETRFIFRPPDHLQAEIQYLELGLSFTDEGGIKGNMLFNTNKGGTFSQFASNTGENVPYEFFVKPTQLFDSNGRVDSRTITNLISDGLMETLNSPK